MALWANPILKSGCHHYHDQNQLQQKANSKKKVYQWGRHDSIRLAPHQLKKEYAMVGFQTVFDWYHTCGIPCLWWSDHTSKPIFPT